ncbi:MAG: hypothetical protein KF773_24220 [Deltaproteobacteria bacterium]|nr:hypothetical protein [Deltaproteobacteria bacterium]
MANTLLPTVPRTVAAIGAPAGHRTYTLHADGSRTCECGEHAAVRADLNGHHNVVRTAHALDWPTPPPAPSDEELRRRAAGALSALRGEVVS